MNKIEKNLALEKRAQDLISSALSAATKRAYASDFQRFSDWAQDHGVSPMPATVETVTLYLTAMVDTHSMASITRCVTSIKTAHNFAHHHSPTESMEVRELLKGIRREKGLANLGASSAISWADLQKMVQHCDGSIVGIRDRAILMLGWAGALRRSELVSLNLDDFEISDKGALITIRKGKTDQEGHGRFIAIPFSVEPLSCPVWAVSKWLIRRTTDISEKNGPLFTLIGSHGSKRWFGLTLRRLSSRWISEVVKKYAAYAGLPKDHYSAHSLRRGLATEAGARGVPERLIARHTGHRSTAVLRTYIDAGNIWDETPLIAIYRSRARELSSFEQDLK